MDAAKSTVKKFMSKSGHHDTEVHETVAPAVQHEQVQQEQHERVQTAVDKEIHQDHYHVTEQPIQHQEVLPEQHHHQAAPVEERSFEHDDREKNERLLREQQSRYRDESQRVEGAHTSTAEPVIAGEHVHHHVHETIQPVIQKQTIEPHVVHTTVPVHEVHHNEAKHHGASALPPMTMDEFKQKGGALTGRGERVDTFDGCPPEGIAGHEGHMGHNEGVSGGVGPGLGRETSDGRSGVPMSDSESRGSG